MKTEKGNKKDIRFIGDKNPHSETISVYTILPDNSEKLIGTIAETWLAPDLPPRFECFDLTGQLLFPPFRKVSTAQRAFAEYANRLSIREEVMLRLRKRKTRKNKGLELEP